MSICRDEKRFLCILSFRNIRELKSNRPLVAQDKSIYTWGHTLWRIPSATNRVSRSQSTRFNPTSLLSLLSLRRSFPFFPSFFFFFYTLHIIITIRPSKGSIRINEEDRSHLSIVRLKFDSVDQ